MAVEQELPYASGEGGAGARVKSSSAFSAKPEQQKDYTSDLAIAESVAALGEYLSCLAQVGALFRKPSETTAGCSIQ